MRRERRPASPRALCQTVSNSVVKVAAAPGGPGAAAERCDGSVFRPAATSEKTMPGSSCRASAQQRLQRGVGQRARQAADRGAADQQVVARGMVVGELDDAVGDRRRSSPQSPAARCTETLASAPSTMSCWNAQSKGDRAVVWPDDAPRRAQHRRLVGAVEEGLLVGDETCALPKSNRAAGCCWAPRPPPPRCRAASSLLGSALMPLSPDEHPELDLRHRRQADLLAIEIVGGEQRAWSWTKSSLSTRATGAVATPGGKGKW